MLALLSLCLTFALLSLAGAQRSFCFGREFYPDDGLYPVFLCTQSNVRFLPNEEEQIRLYNCADIAKVYGLVDELKHDTRQQELSQVITAMIQKYCLLPLDQEKISKTIKELAIKSNKKIEQ